MKLTCNVEVIHRLLNLPRRKSQKSCLAIGRHSVKSDEIYLLHQTQSNKLGTKYKINDNIVKVFTKFINEGKATIRLKEPQIDLNIQCDMIQLKSFLHVLRLGLLKKLDPAILNLSNMKPKELKNLNKTRIVIRTVSEYPVLQGFPRSTEVLDISNLERRSFDRQILKLQSLKILNLSSNQLTTLPHELGMLSNLQELHLSHNFLGKGPLSKWSWLSGINICKSLRLLNISFNEIKIVPDQINKLQGLCSLYLNDNSISELPQGIGNLTKLKYLNIAKNNLTYLPGSMKNLNLHDLDVSDNPFVTNVDHIPVCNIKIPTLLDIAAQVVIQARIYYDSSIIPRTLVQYLDKAEFCMCGVPCFKCFARKFIKINLSVISDSIKFSGVAGNHPFFNCYFCSTKCLNRYSKLQFMVA